MGQRILVGALLLITAAYCWGLVWIAVGFARSGGVVGGGLAIGVGIFLVLTVWAIWRELLFGFAAARLSRLYQGQGSPADAGGTGSGDDATQREEFDAARTAIEDGDGQEWRAWFRLAIAYDALRDRRRARSCVRRAIALEAGRTVREQRLQ